MKQAFFAWSVFMACIITKLGNALPLPSPYASTPSNPLGCYVNGRIYPLNSDIDKGQSGTGCYGTYCNDRGKVVKWYNWNCDKESTVPSTQPTTVPTTFPPTTVPTTIPPVRFGCYDNGKFFPPNSKIDKGKSGNWCYGRYCDNDGNIISWDDWNCGTETTVPPSEPTTVPTTFPPTTVPTTIPPVRFGCYDNGKFFPPNSKIDKGKSGNWCYGRYCDNDGNIISWDDWNCGTETTVPPSEPTNVQTTPPPVTSEVSKSVPPLSSLEPTTLTSTLPQGCLYEGKVFPPNSEVYKSRIGNRCHGAYCDKDRRIVVWDDFNCNERNSRTVPPPSTLPPTTTTTTHFPTAPSGCWVDGKLYPPWSEVSKGRSGNWCFGTYCDEQGQLIPWDDFNCNSLTTTPPTRPRGKSI